MKKNRVICLFDYTGNMGRPWAEAGYEVYCYDYQHDKEPRTESVGKGSIKYIHWDCYNPLDSYMIGRIHRKHAAMMFSFPMCTDLAVSGARHFEAKRAKNPDFHKVAMQAVYTARDIGEALGCPYFIENPISMISTFWRKPDFKFDPCDYGGYLPEDDVHPRWPEYIMPRDAYTKKTCLWTGGGFIMPEMKRVEPVTLTDSAGNNGSHQWKKLGGKSMRTKNIRSATACGFAKAVFIHYGKEIA